MPVETPTKNVLDAVRNQLEKLFQSDDHKLILHNNDLVYYLDVISGLKNVLGYSQLQAYNMTMKVHYNNQAVVFNGSQQELEQYKQELYDNYGLTTTIE